MTSPLTGGVSRRRFLGYSAALPFLFQELAEAQRKRVKIRDVQVMMLQGASRTYTLVKITADDGLHGIASMFVVVDAAAIALLGPGAFSVDAHFFGRREIRIPHQLHSSKS